MTQVILLNYDYAPISIVSLRKALKLLVKERAEIVKTTTIKIHENFCIPKVIRLLKSVAFFFKRHLPFSKHNVFVRDGFHCVYCGKEMTDKHCTIDHVLPSSRGGKNDFMNTVTSCYSCNNRKNDRTPEEAGMKLLKHPKIPTLMDLIQIKFKDHDFSDLWA
jgi:5-methylcytosine-specific restriction endonuclease McrA